MNIISAIKAAIAQFVDQRERSVVIHSLRGQPQISIGMRQDARRSAASLLKLPLAMTVWDMGIAGYISLSGVVRTRELERTRYPSIMNVFEIDHEFLVSEICGIMLATSDNSCAQYLVNLVGLERVNTFLKSSHCRDSLMAVGFSDNELLSPLARSSYTTGSDITRIMSNVYNATQYTALLEFLKQGQRKNRIPRLLPADLPVANKTGSLQGVVNDAAIIYGEEYDLSVVVLADAENGDMLTGAEIGDLVKTIWELLGESRTGDLRRKHDPHYKSPHGSRGTARTAALGR